jgi:ABC-type sugar transport system permease subunit
MLLVAGMLLYPLLTTLYYSVLSIGPLTSKFAGMANYVRTFSDPAYYTILGRTLIIVFGSVAVQVFLGLVIALLINRTGAFANTIRTAALIPWSMALSITGLLWKFMLNPVFGIVSVLVNRVLLIFNSAAEPVRIIGDFPILTVIWIDTWQNTPFVMLFCLAGLQTIPSELEDAARVDGASGLQRLMRVTLPLLRPVLLVIVLFRSIWALGIFAIPWALSGGEVVGSLEVTAIRAYRLMFSYLQFDRGSAEIIVLAVLSIVLCLFFIRTVFKEL